MRRVILDIEAGRLPEELARRGISPRQRVHAVVDTEADDDPSPTALNAAGGSFDRLDDETDLYTDADLVERYR